MSKERDEKWLELHKAGKAEWVPGMLWWYSERAFERYELADGQRPIEHGAVPDWSDPATLGCLLAQVRKRYINPRLYTEPNGHEGWGLASPSGMVRHECRVIFAPTEAGVCLRALECAPVARSLVDSRLDRAWRERAAEGDVKWSPGMLALTSDGGYAGRVVRDDRTRGVRLFRGGPVLDSYVPDWSDRATVLNIRRQWETKCKDTRIRAAVLLRALECAP